MVVIIVGIIYHLLRFDFYFGIDRVDNMCLIIH